MTRLILAIWLCLSGAALANEAVVDAVTGRLITGAGADQPRYPASTTKLMTIYVALDAAAKGEVSLDEMAEISAHAAAAPPVKLGLKAGARIKLSAALHAALVLSSNDAARVVADAVSGGEAAFARRMTATAARLGMTATRFTNATGLPDPDHISTAEDIARLIWRLDQRFGAYLRPLFRQPVAAPGGARSPRNATVAGVPGARLGKTGYTCDAGYTAAALLDGPDGPRAVATLANSGTKDRAISLARLARGVARAHVFTPPCVSGGGVRKPPAPVAAIGEWSLTLGVFDDRRSAMAALRESRRIVARAERVVAIRPNRRGFYAVMLAGDRLEAEKLRRRLIRGGLKANLIDHGGRRALSLRVHSKL